jgi:hypothetical protein
MRFENEADSAGSRTLLVATAETTAQHQVTYVAHAIPVEPRTVRAKDLLAAALRAVLRQSYKGKDLRSDLPARIDLPGFFGPVITREQPLRFWLSSSPASL